MPNWVNTLALLMLPGCIFTFHHPDGPHWDDDWDTGSWDTSPWETDAQQDSRDLSEPDVHLWMNNPTLAPGETEIMSLYAEGRSVADIVEIQYFGQVDLLTWQLMDDGELGVVLRADDDASGTADVLVTFDDGQVAFQEDILELRISDSADDGSAGGGGGPGGMDTACP